jgi:hypothetical protein
MDWLIAHAFWVLGAAAVFVGFLFSVHAMLQSIRRHASLLALALLTASIILWPARVWVTHHPQLATPQTTIEAIITVALWLSIAAVPLAIIGRPRLAPLVVIAAVITFVFWARTTPQTSVWTILRVRNPIASPAQQSIKPSPALANSVHQPTPTSSHSTR